MPSSYALFDQTQVTPGQSTGKDLVKERIRQRDLITKALPQFCRNFISSR